MNRYNRPDFTTSRVEAPEVGSILTDFADRQQRQYQLGLSNAMEQAKAAEEKKRWDITNARAEAQAKRQEDEYQRGIAKETATNEALKAVLDPKKYQESKMAGEQAAIQSSLANLSPQDRVVAEQEIKANYRPEVSREQWLATALSGDNADQSKVLTTKNALLNMRLNDPTSDEYEAKVKADRAEKEWAINTQANKQMQLEKYRADLADKKESKALAGLLAGFQTPTEKEVEVGKTSNQGVIDSVNKVNAAYEKKATDYGNKYKELLENDKTLGSINNQIIKLDEHIVNERAKAGAMGSEVSPNVSSLERNKLGLEASRDRLIGALDAKAKGEIGLRDDWQRSIRDVPAFTEMVETKVKPLSREEWINQAVGNVGDRLTTSSLKEILARADKRFPEIDPKEKLRILEKQGTAEDIKNTIKAVTGKEATSNTLEGLKEELSVANKKKPASTSYGVGPLSLSTMVNLGVDDDDIKAIKEKAVTSKISDKDLEKMIKDVNSRGTFPTLSGTIKNDVSSMIDTLSTAEEATKK